MTSKFTIDKADWHKFEESLTNKVKIMTEREIFPAQPDKMLLIQKIRLIRRVL